MTVPPEEHCLLRGPAGDFNGLIFVMTARSLLAIPRDDEEGVVDSDRETDHPDHVDYEKREVHELTDDCRQPDCNENGDESQQNR